VAAFLIETLPTFGTDIIRRNLNPTFNANRQSDGVVLSRCLQHEKFRDKSRPILQITCTPCGLIRET
jgi:hypothetical protein